MEKAFLHFLQNFCHIWWFFTVERRTRCCGNLKNHQILLKFGKKWRKALFDLPSTHLSTDSGYPKIRFLFQNKFFDLGTLCWYVLGFFWTPCEVVIKVILSWSFRQRWAYRTFSGRSQTRGRKWVQGFCNIECSVLNFFELKNKQQKIR